MWSNNTSTASIALNPVYYAWTKNIEVDVHFVKDKVSNKEIEIRHVPTTDQVVDILTKGRE